MSGPAFNPLHFNGPTTKKNCGFPTHSLFYILHVGLNLPAEHRPCRVVRYRHQVISSSTNLRINYRRLVPMVLLLDFNTEIGALVSSNFCYLICIRHLVTKKSGNKLDFFLSITTCFPTCVRNMFWVTILYKYQLYQQWIRIIIIIFSSKIVTEEI